jgi:AraC-like DNA-binding protein
MLSNLIENGSALKAISVPRARHPLHAMPTSAGYDLQADPNYIWDGRLRGQVPFTVFQHTISGTGTLRYENRLIKLRPGESFLVLVPHNHCYWVEKGDKWEFFWISTNGTEALRIHEAVLNAHGPILHLKSNCIDKLASCVLRLVQGKAETPGEASAIAYEAAMALYDGAFGPSERLLDSENAINRAMQYVSTNLGSQLPVDILAGVAGLSRAHFSRSFANLTGLAPAEYVMQQRMKRAAKLLTTNRELPVKEIAALVGMLDNNYFSKVFRRSYGVTPTEFRETAMSSTRRR